MNEDKDYAVTLTLRLSTVVSFAPMEREGPLTYSDAIENAIGSLPSGWLATVEGEGFAVAYPIDGEVTNERNWT